MGHVRLETTTICVRVAKPVDETLTPSPLDRLYHPPTPRGNGRHRPNVGRLRLHFQPQVDSDGRRSAKVTTEVPSAHRPIYFTGTTSVEVRLGFVTLQIPPLERRPLHQNLPKTYSSARQISRNLPLSQT